MLTIERDRPLGVLTTLCAGGTADEYALVQDSASLIEAAREAHDRHLPATIIGWGSNLLVSDDGVRGLVIHNAASRIDIEPNGRVTCETGAAFQDLFLKTAQRGLGGFDYAVGIPGTVGGALVSNAGAYRAQISEYLVELQVFSENAVQTVGPDWMEFGYRDSKLRRKDQPSQAVLIKAVFELPKADMQTIYHAARDFQRQRISKQPPSASAGSFFKNVQDQELAQRLPTLPQPLKDKGIVPAGYLIEAVGLKGHRQGPVAFGSMHANFILNLGGATATQIRQLADYGKARVYQAYGVHLEEEVLYLGDWSRYPA